MNETIARIIEDSNNRTFKLFHSDRFLIQFFPSSFVNDFLLFFFSNGYFNIILITLISINSLIPVFLKELLLTWSKFNFQIK